MDSRKQELVDCIFASNSKLILVFFEFEGAWDRPESLGRLLLHIDTVSQAVKVVVLIDWVVVVVLRFLGQVAHWHRVQVQEKWLDLPFFFQFFKHAHSVVLYQMVFKEIHLIGSAMRFLADNISWLVATLIEMPLVVQGYYDYCVFINLIASSAAIKKHVSKITFFVKLGSINRHCPLRY